MSVNLRVQIITFTPIALKRAGCLRGSSTISLIWASCFLYPSNVIITHLIQRLFLILQTGMRTQSYTLHVPLPHLIHFKPWQILKHLTIYWPLSWLVPPHSGSLCLGPQYSMGWGRSPPLWTPQHACLLWPGKYHLRKKSKTKFVYI